MHGIHAHMQDLARTLPWDDLRFFLAAAREGGFGAAARLLGTEQSTVSRRVASLERALGARLFDRSRAGLAQTQLGRALLVEAEIMEASFRRVADLAASEERAPVGLVRVATTETMASAFVVPLVLPALFDRYPGLRIDLVVGDTPADLERREADIAIRFFLSRSGDLLTKRVATLATGVLAERGLARRLAGQAPAAWPWLSAWLAEGPVPEESVRLSFSNAPPRLTMNSFQTQWAAVRAGLGVAVLPRVLRDAGTVELALPEGDEAPLPPVPLYLATRRSIRRLPRIAAVFDALATALGALE